MQSGRRTLLMSRPSAAGRLRRVVRECRSLNNQRRSRQGCRTCARLVGRYTSECRCYKPLRSTLLLWKAKQALSTKSQAKHPSSKNSIHQTDEILLGIRFDLCNRIDPCESAHCCLAVSSARVLPFWYEITLGGGGDWTASARPGHERKLTERTDCYARARVPPRSHVNSFVLVLMHACYSFAAATACMVRMLEPAPCCLPA